MSDNTYTYPIIKMGMGSWSDCLFMSHISKEKLIEKATDIFDYAFYIDKMCAKTRYYTSGSYVDVLKLQDANGNEIPLVLKVYRKKVNSENQEKISSTIHKWHAENHPLAKYFLRYVYLEDGCKDFSRKRQSGPMVLMERAGGLNNSSSVLNAEYLLKSSADTILKIADEFLLMMQHFDAANVGYGDLSADNIVVEEIDGAISLKLVDYDDVYVEGVEGNSFQLGKNGYQHKSRISTNGPKQAIELSKEIHYFSSILFYLTLLLLASPEFDFRKELEDRIKYGDNHLLFTQKELESPSEERGIFGKILTLAKDERIKKLAAVLFEYANKESTADFKSLPSILECPPLVSPEEVFKSNDVSDTETRKQDSANKTGSNPPTVNRDTIPLETVPKEDVITIIYHGNGLIDNTVSKTYSINTTWKIEDLFSFKGRTFEGWALTPSGTPVYFNGTEFGPKNPINVDDKNQIHLYAQWKGIKYKITYDGNGADNKDSYSSTHTYDVVSHLNKNQFTRTGFTFAGWSRSQNGEPEFKDENVVIYLLDKEGAELVLYAQWKPITYTVTYHGNDDEVTGSMPPSKHTYDEAKRLSKNTFVHKYKHSNIFMGWTTKTGEVYIDGQDVVNLTDKDGDEVHLYAMWQPRYHVVTYYADEDTSSEKSYSIHQYNQDFKLKKNPFQKDGYQFKGWTSKPGGPEEYVDQKLIPASKVKYPWWIRLYAVWEKYEVIFIKDANSNESVSSTHIIGKKQKLKANAFIRDGYVFDGWMDKNGKKYTDQQEVLNLTDKDGGKVYLRATWKLKEELVDKNKKTPRKEDTTYTLIYHGNGANEDKVYSSSNHSLEKDVTLMNNPYTKNGHLFTGWRLEYLDELLKENSIVHFTGSLPKNKEIHLYAQWKKTESVIPPLIGGIVSTAIAGISGITMMMLPNLQFWTYYHLSVLGIVTLICSLFSLVRVRGIKGTDRFTTILSIIIPGVLLPGIIIGTLVFNITLGIMIGAALTIYAITQALLFLTAMVLDSCEE